MTDEHVPVIAHWVDGKVWEGAGERTAPVYDPATGAVAATVRLASDGRRGRRRRLGLGGRGRVAPRLAQPAHPGAVRLPRAGARAPRRAGRRPHRPARQGHGRRARRGRPAASRSSSSPAASRSAEGRPQRAGVDRRRRALGPPAPRRRGRHHAVQLPGHGADVDVPRGHRLRERLRAQAVRARPRRLAPARRPVGRRRACPTACSRWSRATRRPSTRCSTTRASPPSASSDRPPSPATCTRRGGPGRQARAGPRRRQEPHGRAARRRPRRGRRRRGERRLRLGGRAVHGHLGRGGRRPDRRRPRRPASPTASRGWSWRRASTPGAEMGPLITDAHRERVTGLVDEGVAEGADLVADGRGLVVDGPRGRVLLRPVPVRQRARPT